MAAAAAATMAKAVNPRAAWTTPLRRRRNHTRRAFTLTELLTVVGLIALLVFLFLPVLGKVRTASDATRCLSNLRQMGAAWTMYTAENRGRFMHYVFRSPDTPDFAWRGYWVGVLEQNSVRAETLLCPVAREPMSYDRTFGFGTATLAWNGKYGRDGSGVRFDEKRYRVGSYGYNRYMTSGNGSSESGGVCNLAALQRPAETPLFIDCAFADVRPFNGSEMSPVEPPPNLRGDRIDDVSPQQWRFLLARHGRGVNVGTADGAARWVALEDTYRLQWNGLWQPYRLRLPIQ